MHQLRLGSARHLTPASMYNAMVVTRRLAVPQICCFICRRLRMQRVARDPRLQIGPRSIARFRVLWTRCRTGRAILPRCKCFWPAACPRYAGTARHGLLDMKVKTVSGETLDACLDWWRESPRRRSCDALAGTGRHRSRRCDHVARSRASRGLTSTVCFPIGNLAPEGSVIKSTAIDPSLVDATRSFATSGPRASSSPKSRRSRQSKPAIWWQGDVIVLICGGPKGSGMQEIYQITAALKELPHCKHVAVLTDARFSGVSTGRLYRPISPEALAGGPIGKVRTATGSNRHRSRDGLPGPSILWAKAAKLSARMKARDGCPAQSSRRSCTASGIA